MFPNEKKGSKNRKIYFDQLFGSFKTVYKRFNRFNRSCILQCDETPIWFDMVSKSAIDFVGTKNIDLITSAHDKTRFTVLLTIAGLKKVPTCRIPY